MKKILLSMAILSLATFGFSQISAVGSVDAKASSLKLLNADRSINAPVAELTHCPNDGVGGNPDFGQAIPDFTVISLFEATEMGNYNGNVIDKIAVGVYKADFSGDLTIKIWTDTSNYGATTVYEQIVAYADVVDGWNEIVLTTPYNINGDALFFGYTINSTAGKGAAYDNTAYAADELGSAFVVPSMSYRGQLAASATDFLSFSVKAYVDDGLDFIDAQIGKEFFWIFNRRRRPQGDDIVSQLGFELAWRTQSN